MELSCRNFLDDAIEIRKLGEGTFGKVILVEKPDKKQYAVKYMPIYTDPDRIGVSKNALLDLDALVRLQKVSDVINVIRICYQNDLIALIMEAMDSDLKAFIAKTSVYERIQLTRKLLISLIRVAALMETLNITHYDIKPQNVLVKGKDFKVTDFGLAEVSFGSNLVPTNELYTLWYRPPEFLAGRDRKTFRVFAGDIWAIGITMLEFIVGKPIFPGMSEYNMLQLIKDKNMSTSDFYRANESGTITNGLLVKNIIASYISAPISEQIDPQIIDMLSRMLLFNPNDRPTGSQLLDELNERINPDFLVSLLPPEYPRRINNEAIEIILQVSQHLNLSKASILIAIEIFTRYLDMVLDDINIYIQALASLRIAQEFAEPNPVETSNIAETYQSVCGFKCINISNLQIAKMEKDILEKINFQIYNLNLTPVIQRVYSNNIDLQKVNLDQFAEPLSSWLIT